MQRLPFLDRARELAWLEHDSGTDGAQFRILYGRRRVGKSALLDEFARGKRVLLYQAVEGGVADQLRDLTAAILATEDDAGLRAAPLANWDAAFAHLSRMAASGPLLVILDEYQYAAESDSTLASRLQRWWSRDANRLPIYLVLCGSYVRFFVKNVLTGPAFGRNTGSLQLRPFNYRDAALFFPGWSAEDRVRAYAVTGGVPLYLLQFDALRSLAWNIAHNVLQRGAVLYQEAELLVREELREPRVYYSILRALSDGLTRVSEITARVRGAGGGSDLSPYLATLQDLELAEYVRPVVGESVRRGIWTVKDPYLRFWFRFVLPYRTRLEHGADGEQFYADVVAPALDHFVSRPTFEEICRSLVLDQVEAGTWSAVERVGAWWGPVPAPTAEQSRRQADAELEVVGVAGKRVVVAGEAKWSREPVGFGVLNHLRDVLRYLPGANQDTQLALFGREFDDRLTDRAAAEEVRLVSPADLFS
jgi:AAA+ ATPase superfamily predicted ATPase